MKILFDIGANCGTRFFDDLSNDQTNTFLYMFEPTPSLINKIKEKYKNLKNWVLVESTVSNFNGKSKFNIAEREGGGCSSLLNFKDNIKQTWPAARTNENGDLNVTEIIEVNVTTLKSFLEEHPEITGIDFLHIDAQGSDLNILKGMEEYLFIVKVGQLEAALEAPLYVGSPTKSECEDFLINNGFKITKIDGGPHEVDIYYRRV